MTFNYKLQTINTKLPRYVVCVATYQPLIASRTPRKDNDKDKSYTGKCHKLWQFQAAEL